MHMEYICIVTVYYSDTVKFESDLNTRSRNK